MRPEVNSNQFKISHRFEMSFRFHGNLHRDFTADFLATLFHCGHLLFTWKNHCDLKFQFSQFDRSEFHSARSHVNADNEVTSHLSEILSRSEISNRFEFTSGLM